MVAVLVALPAMLFGVVTFAPSLLLLLLAAPTASVLLQLALSRSRELAADRTAASLTRDPAGLASALALLDRANRTWLGWLLGWRRPPQSNHLLLSHPPTRERIRRLHEMTRLPAARSQERGPRATGSHAEPRVIAVR